MVIETWLWLSELKLICLSRMKLNCGTQTWQGGPGDRLAHGSPHLGTVTIGQDLSGVVSVNKYPFLTVWTHFQSLSFPLNYYIKMLTIWIKKLKFLNYHTVNCHIEIIYDQRKRTLLINEQDKNFFRVF